MESLNRPLAHYRFDFKILCFMPFFIRFISLTTNKLVLGLARAMQRL
jgi:hypothetical protein